MALTGWQRKHSLYQDLLIGVASGLAASALTGPVDRFLDRYVSRSQRRRERMVRLGSAHELAGPLIAERISGRRLTPAGHRLAKSAFSVGYGILWGAIYAGVRRRIPQSSRFFGLPFAVPFFLTCDAAVAPMLKLNPTVNRIPWQLNLKELANHIVWTSSAELFHRVVDWTVESKVMNRLRNNINTGLGKVNLLKFKSRPSYVQKIRDYGKRVAGMV